MTECYFSKDAGYRLKAEKDFWKKVWCMQSFMQSAPSEKCLRYTLHSERTIFDSSRCFRRFNYCHRISSLFCCSGFPVTLGFFVYLPCFFLHFYFILCFLSSWCWRCVSLSLFADVVFIGKSFWQFSICVVFCVHNRKTFVVAVVSKILLPW